jgi:hypothetical protein
MSVTLSQTTDAAFPDRGEMGLRITMASGSAGQYVSHDLGQPRSRLHMRFLLRLGSAGSGAVQIAGAQQPDDSPAWSLTTSGTR